MWPITVSWSACHWRESSIKHIELITIKKKRLATVLPFFFAVAVGDVVVCDFTSCCCGRCDFLYFLSWPVWNSYLAFSLWFNHNHNNNSNIYTFFFSGFYIDCVMRSFKLFDVFVFVLFCLCVCVRMHLHICVYRISFTFFFLSLNLHSSPQ